MTVHKMIFKVYRRLSIVSCLQDIELNSEYLPRRLSNTHILSQTAEFHNCSTLDNQIYDIRGEGWLKLCLGLRTIAM